MSAETFLRFVRDVLTRQNPPLQSEAEADRMLLQGADMSDPAYANPINAWADIREQRRHLKARQRPGRRGGNVAMQRFRHHAIMMMVSTAHYHGVTRPKAKHIIADETGMKYRSVSRICRRDMSQRGPDPAK